MDQAERRKENGKFLCYLGVFALVIFILYVPQGLEADVYKVAIVAHGGYVFALLLLYRTILAKADAGMNKALRYLFVFLSIFAFSMFLTEEKFGGADVYQMILLCGCLSVMLYEKREWAVLPLSMAAVGIGPENVLLYGSAVPFLLLYKGLVKAGTKGKKYVRLCVLTVVAGVFMFVLRGGLGFFSEITFFCNFRRLGIFLLCFIPYIVMAIFFFRGFVKDKGPGACRFILLLGGIVPLLPLLLKNQGGNGVFAVILYYVLIVGALLVAGDAVAVRQMEQLKEALRERKPISVFVLAYPILFIPLNNEYICRTVDRMVGMIFR